MPGPMGHPMGHVPVAKDHGTRRQWEARVRRMIRQGCRRDEILFAMGEANWPFEEASALVTRLASSERWTAIGMMAGLGILGLLGVLILIVSIDSDGEAFGLGLVLALSGIGGFIYGLIRLVKVSA